MTTFKRLFYFGLPGLLLLTANTAWACTLWGATGQATKDHGTIIAKNRDWAPSQRQWLAKFPADKGKLALMGICVAGREKPDIKAGINEKGLVVVTANASCIPKSIRSGDRTGKILTAELLAKYDSVAAILSSAKIFQNSRPNFYLLADQAQLAYIEVGLDGQYAVRSTTDGILCHTNHYLETSLAAFNLKIGKSSRVRYQRINGLLAGQPSGLTGADFRRMSNDTADGPDCSLFRTGSKPGLERTVATWIVILPPNAPPTLDVKLLNSGQAVRKFHFSLGRKFWRAKTENRHRLQKL